MIRFKCDTNLRLSAKCNGVCLSKVCNRYTSWTKPSFVGSCRAQTRLIIELSGMKT